MIRTSIFLFHNPAFFGFSGPPSERLEMMVYILENCPSVKPSNLSDTLCHISSIKLRWVDSADPIGILSGDRICSMIFLILNLQLLTEINERVAPLIIPHVYQIVATYTSLQTQQCATTSGGKNTINQDCDFRDCWIWIHVLTNTL